MLLKNREPERCANVAVMQPHSMKSAILCSICVSACSAPGECFCRKRGNEDNRAAIFFEAQSNGLLEESVDDPEPDDEDGLPMLAGTRGPGITSAAEGEGVVSWSSSSYCGDSLGRGSSHLT